MRKIIYLTGCLILLFLTTCKDKNGITNNKLFDLVISQISPDSGRFGTEVTITGISFRVTPEENTVTFNGIEAEVAKVADTGLVEATVAGQTAVGPEFNLSAHGRRFNPGWNRPGRI